MLKAYAIIFFAGSFFSLLAFLLLLPFFRRRGFLDHPSPRKTQKNPVPYGGGVVIFVSLSALSLLGFLGQSYLPESFFPSHLLAFESWHYRPDFLAIAFGGVTMFILGLSDDIWGLSALKKLSVQIVVFSLVVALGPRMSFFSSSYLLGFGGTLFWLLLVSNAFNLMDNMDGLCTSTALIALLTHGLLLHFCGQYMIASLTIALVSSLCLFAFFNFPPARMYLGDAGSLLIGYSIGILSILSTYYEEGKPVLAILTPLLILSVPLYDVASVMLIRYKNKRPFFQGDRNHFSHRLLKKGFSEKQVLLKLGFISITLSLLSLGLNGLLSFGWVGSVALLFFFCNQYFIFAQKEK